METTYTEEDIARFYSSSLDSVYLINALVESNTTKQEDIVNIKRNVSHLAIMLGKDYWTIEDLTPLKDAVVSGSNYIGEIVPDIKELTPEEVKSNIVAAVSKRLNAFAQTRNYDSILSACTYATSSAPQFAQEGQYCVNMRDATWGKLYQIMQEVEAGTRPMPTGYADIEPELPVLDWASVAE